MTDNDLMPFGKYKGTKMANVPAHYLLHLFNNCDWLSGKVKSYIVDNLEELRSEAQQTNTKQTR